jgi:superfamily II DNA or RNA helicase
VFIHGSTDDSERKEHYAEVAISDDKRIIATYGIAAVGINVPKLHNIVLIEPGKSFVRVIQSIGRVLRLAPGKDFANVWDITSSLKYSKRHLTKRKKFYAEAQYPYSVTKVDWQ